MNFKDKELFCGRCETGFARVIADLFVGDIIYAEHLKPNFYKITLSNGDRCACFECGAEIDAGDIELYR